MKKKLCVAVLFIFFVLFSSMAFCNDYPTPIISQNSNLELLSAPNITPATTIAADDTMKRTIDDEKRSGCCSWHGGVCGCTGGRAQCCDGTLSPSCGCAK